MLFNEPKLLKCSEASIQLDDPVSFSALQRAEIAEMQLSVNMYPNRNKSFSALQRAEIAEIEWSGGDVLAGTRFSALQRAEIAEIHHPRA